MRYSKETIQEVVEKNDIVDVINEHVALQKRGSTYFCECPFHEEKTPSYTVSEKSQLAYCQAGCQGGDGNVVNFWMAYHRVPFPEAVRALARRVGVELPTDKALSDDEKKRIAGRSEAYGALGAAKDFYHSRVRELPKVSEYLKARGLSDKTVETFGIGGASEKWRDLIDHMGGIKAKDALVNAGLAHFKKATETEKGKFYDIFRNGVIFPIEDHRGRVVSMAVRRLDDGPNANPTKYRNGAETDVFKKGEVAYGLKQVLDAEREPSHIAVFEGYMDVLTTHQAGMTNTVATMGTSPSSELITRLFRYTDKLLFVFDGDQAGKWAAQRALHQALPLLDDTKRASFAFLPQGDDPDSIVRERGIGPFQDLVKKSAMTASSFILKLAQDGEPLSSPESRGACFSRAKEMVDQMPVSNTKRAILANLEEITGIRPSEYLPYSIEVSEGALRGHDLEELSQALSETLAEKLGVATGDVRVAWEIPEIKPDVKIPVPDIHDSDQANDLRARMRDVQRILQLETPLASSTTVKEALKLSQSPNEQTQKLAQALLENHLNGDSSIVTQLRLVKHHLEVVGSAYQRIIQNNSAPPEVAERIERWLLNQRQMLNAPLSLVQYMNDEQGGELTTVATLTDQYIDSVCTEQRSPEQEHTTPGHTMAGM